MVTLNLYEKGIPLTQCHFLTKALSSSKTKNKSSCSPYELSRPNTLSFTIIIMKELTKPLLSQLERINGQYLK